MFTARMAAVVRASHLLVDDPPAVFRDDYALTLSEFEEADAIALAHGFEPAVGAVYRTTTLVRARFTDEQLEEAVAHGIAQYVILGAGLDSFVWRRPELAAKLQVFEVDHPGTQGYKQQRVAAAGLPIAPTLQFVPLDFTSDADLAQALGGAGFDPYAPTFWSWLGVMVYLTHDQIRTTLNQLAELSAPGSVVVADFLLRRSLMDDAARAADDIGRPVAADQGEPYVSTFAPGEAAALVASAGWSDCRTWMPFDFAAWFEHRTDSLGPSSYVGLVVARQASTQDV